MSEMTLEQLREALENNNNKGGRSTGLNNYYPFWDIPYDSQTVIRFLPDKDATNPFGFFVRKFSHKLDINGRIRKVTCPETYGKGRECPICSASQQFYKSGDQKNGSKYWRRPQYVAQALIISSPLKDGEEEYEGTVKLVAINPTLYKIIDDSCATELDHVPFSYENGTDFIIKKTKQGEYADYSLSKFARKETTLEPEVVMEIEDQMRELSSVLPMETPIDKLEAMLDADMTGSPYEDEGTKQDRADIRSKISSFANQHASVSDSDSSSDDAATTQSQDVDNSNEIDEEDEQVANVLAKIRQRNAK